MYMQLAPTPFNFIISVSSIVVILDKIIKQLQELSIIWPQFHEIVKLPQLQLDKKKKKLTLTNKKDSYFIIILTYTYLNSL